MKILIIAFSRSGGTSLMKWVSSELNLRWIQDPTAEHRNENKIKEAWKFENTVVKINPWEYETEVQKHFDKTIILIRENLNDIAVSLCKANERNLWHSQYKIDEAWLKQNENRIKEYEADAERYNKKSLSWKTDDNLLVTYSGIYETGQDIERLKEYLGLNETKYIKILHPDNRYRTNKITKVI
jgi:flavodoxin